jgi:hypothetical protein
MDETTRQQLRDAARKVLDANTDEELVLAHTVLTKLQAEPRTEGVLPPPIYPADLIYRLVESNDLVPLEEQQAQALQQQPQQPDKPPE